MNRRVSAVLLILSACLWSCGGASGPERGTAGQSAASRGLSPDWAILSIPTGGGTATLHSPSDPTRELWSGTVTLPPVESAVRVAPRLVALRGADGDLYRYDPAEDAVSRLGTLGGELTWYAGEEAGVWVRTRSGGATLWRMPGQGDRREVSGDVRWAAPAAGGATVALVGEGPATLVRWSRGSDSAEARMEVRAGPPGVVTAWGRMAALAAEGTHAVQVVSLESMEPVDRFEVGGPVTALAASPSSHEWYVAVDSPPRLIVIERISGETRTRARFERPIRDIRPGAAGGPPVAWDGRAAWLVPWGSGEPVRLEGAEWRADLPVSLADGSVLVARDGRVYRALVEGDGRLAAGSAERLWLPIRWRAQAEEAGLAARTEGPSGDTAAAVDTTGAAGGAATPDSAPTRATAADSARVDPELRVGEPGFYVAVDWARSPSEIGEQLQPMREAGYPVAVERRRDDAGRRWYRGLVGPYAERSRAAEVGRTLRRDFGLEGRVEEVRPGLPSNEVLR